MPVLPNSVRANDLLAPPEITLEFARPLRKDQPQPEYLGTVSLSRSGSSISDGMGAVARYCRFLAGWGNC